MIFVASSALCEGSKVVSGSFLVYKFYKTTCCTSIFEDLDSIQADMIFMISMSNVGRPILSCFLHCSHHALTSDSAIIKEQLCSQAGFWASQADLFSFKKSPNDVKRRWGGWSS